MHGNERNLDNGTRKASYVREHSSLSFELCRSTRQKRLTLSDSPNSCQYELKLRRMKPRDAQQLHKDTARQQRGQRTTATPQVWFRFGCQLDIAPPHSA
jgi:hypothetical protein